MPVAARASRRAGRCAELAVAEPPTKGGSAATHWPHSLLSTQLMNQPLLSRKSMPTGPPQYRSEPYDTRSRSSSDINNLGNRSELANLPRSKDTRERKEWRKGGEWSRPDTFF
jgi:hypothetical protein